MTNHFILDIRNKNYKIKSVVVKTPEQVLKIVNEAKKRGCMSCLIRKFIKPRTSFAIAFVDFSKFSKDEEINIPQLYADWRIIDGNVVDWNIYQRNLKKKREKKEREEER